MIYTVPESTNESRCITALEPTTGLVSLCTRLWLGDSKAISRLPLKFDLQILMVWFIENWYWC